MQKDNNPTEVTLKSLSERYLEAKDDLRMIFETDFNRAVSAGAKMGLPASQECIDKYQIK